MLFAVTPMQGLAKDKTEDQLKLAKDAKSAILMVADTGTVLYSKNADEKLPPASMTKIMTMLLIMDALDKGKISLNESVRTSEHAASMGGSQIYLEPGETMTVDQMLRGIAIGSANDASMAMAEKIAGSEEAFVKMMNEKAKELGLTHTHFVNPTGLPAKNHYSSAHDMAIMARALLQYGKKITKYTGTYEDYLREDSKKKFWLVNTNRLVKFYPGVDGLKTGFTNEAKYCLTASALKNGMRVIAVVMGAPKPKVRNAEITNMLDYAYSQYQTHKVYGKGAVVKEAALDKGVDKKVPVVTQREVAILTKKGESPRNLEKVIEVRNDLKAPLAKGEQVGKLLLKKDGKVVSEFPLVAGKDVPKASWWHLFKRSIGNLTFQSNLH
ncbi:MAG TPA: D-alanyl-D-alanine carboxypeptidase family protein [Bacillales bacterium]|nr:D-alanyl-D-alanine carboxypeptidase family protein [Bacillales bacterium]